MSDQVELRIRIKGKEGTEHIKMNIKQGPFYTLEHVEFEIDIAEAIILLSILSLRISKIISNENQQPKNTPQG